MDNIPLERVAKTLRSLHTITTAPHVSLLEKLKKLLSIGCEQFNLPIGIVSRIIGDRYEIIQAVSPKDILKKGQIYELGETLCRDTILNNRIYTFENIGKSEWSKHPAYLKDHLEAYIGIPVHMNGTIYGTLNFSSPEPREINFSDTDREVLKLMAQWVGSELWRVDATEKMQHNLQEIAALNSLSTAVNESLSLSEVARTALQEIASAINPDLGVVYVCEGSDLIQLQVYPKKAEFEKIGHEVNKIGECLCGMAAAGETVYSEHIADDERCTFNDCKDIGAKSFAAIPIKRGTKILGVLGLASFELRDFKLQSLFIESMAAQVAIGMQNALLYEREHQLVQELQKRMDEVLEGERKLKLSHFMLDNAGDAVFWIDDTATILYVNQKACSSLGYRADELIGMKVADIDPQFPPVKWNKQMDVVRKAESKIITSEKIRKDGSTFPVEIRIKYLPYEGKEYFCTFARDITERLEVEKEHEKIKQQLNQAQKMESVGRLAGGVAHDFNNLLTSILGYSELALLDLPPEHRCHENFQIIRSAGEKAAILVRQLLAFSRKQKVNMEVVNLNKVIQNISKMLKRIIGEDVVLQIKALEPLKNIMADIGQIEQILMNLAVNARDAMPTGGYLNIETGITEFTEEHTRYHTEIVPGQYVMMAVADSGVGIEPSDQDKIFEPFFTTKEKGKGTGLGLASVYGIVKQHKGHIFLYSEKNKGTTFKIYIPAVEQIEVQDKPMEEKEFFSKGDETILVVDDDSSIRQLIVDTLQPLGYKLYGASSGSEALEVVKEAEKPIDLLLTDVIMPNMNGQELAKKIRRQYPHIKIAFMSGYLETVIKGIEEYGGNKVFMEKPLTPSSLAKMVRSILDRT